MNQRLKEIRDSERKSHTEIYTNRELYQEGSWLSKPIKTVMELMPLFQDYRTLHVLDPGCGVGRNCIAIARCFQKIPCVIDCVDILELAIDRLHTNAEKYGVSACIRGVVCPIEKYPVRENHYDLILAISALEHIDSRESFAGKLREIRTFAGWTVLKSTVQNQQYDIPREQGMRRLCTNVVTFVAKK